MKKLALILAICLLATPAFAKKPSKSITIVNNNTEVTNVTNEVKETHNTAGVKVDAPNLVILTNKLTLGVEGGKDIAHDIFYPDDYGYFESDRGYFGYIKLTYTGSIFDFTKK